MSCNCTRVNKLARCDSAAVTVGTISSATTAVHVYIKRLPNGRTHRQEMTTDGSGTVTLDMTDPSSYFFDETNTFELWVTLATADNPYEKETITIGTDTDDCLLVQFENMYDENGNIIQPAGQTMTI